MNSSEERKTSDRPTMRMCRFISDVRGPCYGAISWCLEKVGSLEPGFYVCDAHLAVGARAAGLPARIELHENDRNVGNLKAPTVVKCTAQ